MREIIYLACPYSHPKMAKRIERFEASAHAAAYLIHQGLFVYSPITMTHPIDLVMAAEEDTMGSDYWVDFDEAFMDVCSEMVILTLPGWEKSNGIKREIAYFEASSKPVTFLHVDDHGDYLRSSSLDDENDNREQSTSCNGA